MDHVNLQVCYLELQPVDNIIVVARKLSADAKANNTELLAKANTLKFGQALAPENAPGVVSP
jgi:hypothetical protein